MLDLDVPSAQLLLHVRQQQLGITAGEIAKPGGPDMNRVIAIAAKHGIRFVQQ